MFSLWSSLDLPNIPPTYPFLGASQTKRHTASRQAVTGPLLSLRSSDHLTDIIYSPFIPPPPRTSLAESTSFLINTCWEASFPYFLWEWQHCTPSFVYLLECRSQAFRHVAQVHTIWCAQISCNFYLGFYIRCTCKVSFYSCYSQDSSAHCLWRFLCVCGC